MEEKVLKALNITPSVYMLRVAHIVLHSLFPIAGALILVAEKNMPFGILGYAIMTFSIFGIMLFLGLDFKTLPKTVLGMAILILSPFIAFIVYKFAFGLGLKMSFIWTVVQELLYVVFLGFVFMKNEKEPSLRICLTITTCAGLYATLVFGWYLWYNGELMVAGFMQWPMYIFLIGGALYQACMSYLRNKPDE